MRDEVPRQRNIGDKYGEFLLEMNIGCGCETKMWRSVRRIDAGGKYER